MKNEEVLQKEAKVAKNVITQKDPSCGRLGGCRLGGAFGTRITALGSRFETAEDFDLLAAVSRKERDETQARAREILASYRASVEARFAPDHPLVLSLPRIYPAAGHTPDAVPLTATWDAAAANAHLTWPASTDADLSHYEIRASHTAAGYSTEDEHVLDRIETDAPLEYRSTDCLTAPGATARYKVHVVLTTGNERGCEAAAVTRPV